MVFFFGLLPPLSITTPRSFIIFVLILGYISGKNIELRYVSLGDRWKSTKRMILFLLKQFFLLLMISFIPILVGALALDINWTILHPNRALREVLSGGGWSALINSCVVLLVKSIEYIKGRKEG